MERPSLTWARLGLVHLVAVLPLLLFISGCTDENPTDSSHNQNNESNPIGLLIAESGCKQFNTQGEGSQTPSDRDCVQYQYDGNSVLSLKHVNAGFNCCPGTISADIEIVDHVITITEHESVQGCHCLCLFDLDYQFESLEPGEYQIEFIELYTEAGDDPLVFTLDLSHAVTGEFCVKRTQYPWSSGTFNEASGSLIDILGCKDLTGIHSLDATQSTSTCIEYNYLPGNILLLTHVNAWFNCCPVIAVYFDVENDTITVDEREVEGNCDCYCLFDLFFEIVNIPPGEYTLIINEPHLAEGDEQLQCAIDLAASPSGICCAERHH